jgi:hypothetical protein
MFLNSFGQGPVPKHSFASFPSGDWFPSNEAFYRQERKELEQGCIRPESFFLAASVPRARRRVRRTSVALLQ